MDLLQLGGALAVVVISTLAAVIRSVKGGYLGNVLDKHVRRGDRVDGKLDDIQDGVDETRSEVQDVHEEVEKVERLMFLLHRGDDGLEAEDLRDRLDIDRVDADLYDDTYDYVDD